MHNKREYYSKRHSRQEMEMIVSEFETSNLTRAEIAAKYGIRCPSSISNWKKTLEREKSCVPLQSKPKKSVSMGSNNERTEDSAEKNYSSLEEEVKALREELSRTRCQLDWQAKRTLALETLIEVAEEHGMPVKKCGAKQ